MSSINKNQKLSERNVFRINVGTIPPVRAESYLKKEIISFKKTPLTDYRDNIYVKKLLTEKFEPVHAEGLFSPGDFFYPARESEVVIQDYFIPTR